MKEESFSFWQTKGKKIAYLLLTNPKSWRWIIAVILSLIILLVVFGTVFFYKKLFQTVMLISWNPYLVGITALIVVIGVYKGMIKKKWGVELGRIRWFMLVGTIAWIMINIGLSAGLFYWIAVMLLSVVFKALTNLLHKYY